jgi:two-component system, OmpR family, phosphate regulon sensor histidine kinase PhoR
LVQLGTKRTALALYGVLLILPTFVLGGLHWRQLALDHETMLKAVPGDAQDAARRLEDALGERLNKLVEDENTRAFFEYKPNYFPPGMIGDDIGLVPSVLTTERVPAAVLGWFSYGSEDVMRGKPPTILVGKRWSAQELERRRDEVLRATLELQQREERESALFRIFRQRKLREPQYALPVVAINLSEAGEDLDCMRDELPALRGLQTQLKTVQAYEFHLRFYREADGTPRVLATRLVKIPADKRLARMPSCFDSAGRTVSLRQGFFIDPNWLFRDMPTFLANQVLKGSQEFIPPGSGNVTLEPGTELITIRPVKSFRFETNRVEDNDFGTLRIAVNKGDLESRFRTQTFRFLGVAAMLVVSLATGLLLLLRSVNRDLEAARRTENFVAAVTHELRTPLAAIRLYGEMLQEGWVEDPEKRAEYYRRIVRETGRLETLVENVLEKSQIARREIKPEPGDLNAAIEGLVTSLTSIGPEGVQDLAFEFSDDLPLVELLPDGVRSIVTNLVENARKYAPVDARASEPEPILVKTHVLAGHVVLDVLDRGPGIPHDQRSKIFEAFYRVGNEQTRTTRGTGLGLHLVALQAQAMGARVQVLDRKGGGTVFRVTFETARDVG